MRERATHAVTDASAEGAGRAHDPLLGRETEMGELVAYLDHARGGQGRLVLVGGEPGIGKTRLADELASRARSEETIVLWGKCWEGGGAPAYWPWVQCLRAYLRTDEGPAVVSRMGPGVADVAHLIPDVKDLVPELPAIPSVDAEAARFRLFDATVTLFRRAAGARPLVVVIDDLHWADPASLLLLRFLAGEVSDMRLLVVATYRDVELTPEHLLTAPIQDLAREPTTRHLLLAGLGRREVGELIGRTTGVAPKAALVGSMHHQTKGNPLFVAEAIKLLTTEGGIRSGTRAESLRASVPAAVREVMLRRLEHLDEASWTILTVGSVLGPEVSLEMVRRVSNLQPRELAGAIDRVITAGLLVEIAGDIGQFRFSHDLVREVLYEEIPPGQRALLHLSVGAALEQHHQGELDRHLGAIAHHYFEGALAGGGSKAVEYGRKAAGNATRQLAYEEAARLYQMALRACGLDEADDAVLRCDLLLELGDAQMRAGDNQGAKVSFEGAGRIALDLGLAHYLARAALGYGGRFVWMRAGNDQRLIPLLVDALEAVGEGDSLLRARLLARFAGALRDMPDPELRSSISREAVEMARRLGHPATLAYALDGRHSAVWAPDTDEERLLIANEMVEIGQSIGDAERVFQGRLYRLGVHMELGNLPAVRIDLEANRRLAEELRQPAQQWYQEIMSAIMALFEGRFREAESLIAQAYELGRHAEVFAEPVRLLQTYALWRELGRAAESEAKFLEIIDDYGFWPWMRCVLVHLYTEIGRREEARVLFEEVAAGDFRDLPWDNDWLMGMALLAEVAARLGDDGRAALLYELIVRFGDRTGFGHPEFSLGSMARPLGLLAETMGRVDDAVDHLERAVALNEEMGARPWVARSQNDLARVLIARDRPGDRERAGSLLSRARQASRELGMAALEAELGPVIGDQPPFHESSSPEVTPAEAIFRREGEYWSVGFDGRSTRLRDTKGMRYLANLLTAPGKELHVLDMVRLEEGLPTGPGRPDPELAAAGWGGAGEILDPQAKAAYGRRLTELQEELEEAESWNDSERAGRAREEIEALTEQLAGAVGLGGRNRKAASAAERARLNVTRAIRTAMGRVAKNHPELGTHLDRTVKTGLYCSYTPDPRAPLNWIT